MAGVLFAVSSLALVAGTFGGDNGDNFLLSRAQIEATTTSDRIGLFVGQHWSQDVFDYYDWYVDAMRVLQTRACGVRYLRNETRDAFLEALSPFIQYQLMPFGTGLLNVSLDVLDDWTRRLRPDYDLDERLAARDILVVVQKAPPVEERAAPDGHSVLNIPSQTTPSVPTTPDGYRIFARRVTPKSVTLPDGLVTVLLAPVECGEAPQK